ncbi:MAG: serine hydrolase domain-containing protein [Vicinamibacterales bacterium]
MTVKKSRFQKWLVMGALAVGLVPTAILGLWWYTTATAPVLHPSPKDVPAETKLAPSPLWSVAVEHARQTVRAGISEQNLPALSVAVGVGGEVVWAEAFGWADLENKVAASPDTRFRIGTASMVLTSAGVGLLLERELLNLDEKIQTYVPEFPEKQWPVTLRQLMGHVAGIRRDKGDEESVTERCGQPMEGVQRFAKYPLLFEPGSDYRFTTYGWMLVSAAIDAVGEQPFFTFMRKQVFDPLGMDHTNANGEPTADRSIDYFPRFAGDPRYGPQEPSELDYSCFSGASGFLSTRSDLVRFGLAIHSGTFLKPATVELLQAPQRLTSGKETGYGLGWDLEDATLAGAQVVIGGHDAELRGGMVGSFMLFRERGLVVSVLSNTAYADTFALGVTIAKAFAEESQRTAK